MKHLYLDIISAISDNMQQLCQQTKTGFVRKHLALFMTHLFDFFFLNLNFLTIT